MRRVLVLVALAAASLGTPAYAQDDQSSCMAQMSATVRPLLQQASQFSPQGVAGQGFAPLTQPFAPGPYGSPAGYYPSAYRITYDAQAKEYRVALSGMRRH